MPMNLPLILRDAAITVEQLLAEIAMLKDDAVAATAPPTTDPPKATWWFDRAAVTPELAAEWNRLATTKCGYPSPGFVLDTPGGKARGKNNAGSLPRIEVGGPWAGSILSAKHPTGGPDIYGGPDLVADGNVGTKKPESIQRAHAWAQLLRPDGAFLTHDYGRVFEARMSLVFPSARTTKAAWSQPLCNWAIAFRAGSSPGDSVSNVALRLCNYGYGATLFCTSSLEVAGKEQITWYGPGGQRKSTPIADGGVPWELDQVYDVVIRARIDPSKAATGFLSFEVNGKEVFAARDCRIGKARDGRVTGFEIGQYSDYAVYGPDVRAYNILSFSLLT